MVLINKSSNGAGAKNEGRAGTIAVSMSKPEFVSETRNEVATGFETTIEFGTGAGSPADPSRIVAPQSLNNTKDAKIDIANQQNIPHEGAPENELMMFDTTRSMLEMVASGLGKLVIVWVMVMVQGGFAFTLQMKDFVFVTVTSLFEGIRIFYASSKNNMQHLPLFEWFQLISAMTTSVLSTMQLYLQDFGHTLEAYKANRDFALNFFYVTALAEAIMLLAYKFIGEWKMKK